jgi:hypothetical protein
MKSLLAAVMKPAVFFGASLLLGAGAGLAAVNARDLMGLATALSLAVLSTGYLVGAAILEARGGRG